LPLTRIQFKEGRIRLTSTRIRHSDFLGVFASKSGDTNSDSVHTDPLALAGESVSRGTRLCASYFLFFLLIYVKTQIRLSCSGIQFKEGRIWLTPTRIRHSEFLGAFASKSGDTNSDSLDTNPFVVGHRSVLLIFLLFLVPYVRTQIRNQDTRILFNEHILLFMLIAHVLTT
jgi:hypothetical protein